MGEWIRLQAIFVVTVIIVTNIFVMSISGDQGWLHKPLECHLTIAIGWRSLRNPEMSGC
jgi:hypothetical protein